MGLETAGLKITRALSLQPKVLLLSVLCKGHYSINTVAGVASLHFNTNNFTWSSRPDKERKLCNSFWLCAFAHQVHI